jgi:hypothetical protein
VSLQEGSETPEINPIINIDKISMERIKGVIEEKHNEIEFTIACWNVRSIRDIKRFNKLKVLLSGLVHSNNHSVDCLVLVEYNDSFKFYELKNYNSVIRSRKESKGGGIARGEDSRISQHNAAFLTENSAFHMETQHFSPKRSISHANEAKRSISHRTNNLSKKLF